MSEEMTATTEAPADAGADGGSFLTQVATAPTPEAPPPAAGSAEEAIYDVENGPPVIGGADETEGVRIPDKFWDAENKQIKAEDAVKSYVNLEKLMHSQDRVTLPTGEDDDEGHERLYSALRPESEDQYDFGERPELPPELPYDEEGEQSYRNWAYANGLSPRQAKGLYDGFVKSRIEEHARFAKARQEQLSQLQHSMQREYGQGYQAALNRAKMTMQKYSDPDFVSMLDETGLGNDPRMIRFAERVGKDMSGETRLQGRAEPVEQPADIQAAISSFNAKHEKALFDRSHPDHSRLVSERSRLFEKLYASDQV